MQREAPGRIGPLFPARELHYFDREAGIPDVAPVRTRERVHVSVEPARPEQGQRLVGSRGPCPVAQREQDRREVGCMIGVEVGDHQVREPTPRQAFARHSMQGARTAVEENPDVAKLHPVRCRGMVRVGKEGARPDNRDAHVSRRRSAFSHAAVPRAFSNASSKRTPTIVLTPSSSIVTP